ncbi:tetratricopeptide repeat protein [Methylomonas paludis]|uniref:Tetratricopeptide repeat protein n=1 Tax=Methylomonas paludis TaxID=1173101 RepID=A0A975ML65_9GAMM|nr:tetratricopeptide repeat protein [Methylomonas paludis]QWF69871.1 tetratricopeptide repeat protein [Methylomonas paludis]
MLIRLVSLITLSALLAACNQKAATELSPQSVLASCQKALAAKDNNTAANDCLFAQLWLAHVQPESSSHAESLTALGDYLLNSNVKAAGENYQKALVIQEKLVQDPAQLTQLELKLAKTYSLSGQWPAAELALKKVLRQLDAGKDKDTLEIADVLNRLGVVELQQKLLADAEQALRRSLTIREAHMNASDAGLGETYNNLGYMYEAMGRTVDADGFYRKAIANQESAAEPRYQALYDALTNLAALLQKQGKLQESEPVWKKLLTVAETGFGKDSVQYATALNNLGLLGLAARNYPAAEKFLQEASTICEKKLGINNLLTAEVANNLAVALANQDKHSQAEAPMRQSAATTQALLGANSSLAQQRWSSLINLENSLGVRSVAAGQKQPVPASNSKGGRK